MLLMRVAVPDTPENDSVTVRKSAAVRCCPPIGPSNTATLRRSWSRVIGSADTTDGHAASNDRTITGSSREPPALQPSRRQCAVNGIEKRVQCKKAVNVAIIASPDPWWVRRSNSMAAAGSNRRECRGRLVRGEAVRATRTATPLVRRLLHRAQNDEPALAVGTRSARQRRREHHVERRNLPALFRPTGVERHPVRLQQVFRRIVVAVRVLHALEQRELAARSHVQLEPVAVDDVVVDAL